MNITFKREPRQNLMVLGDLETNDPFEETMLERIKDSSLLPFQTGYEAGEKAYCYDITSLQPFDRLAEQKGVGETELRFLILQLDRALSVLEDYMLSGSNLMLSSSMIYADAETMELRFCAVPGAAFSFEAQLSELFSALLFGMRSGESGGVLLCHRLYRLSRGEVCSMRSLLEALSQSEGTEGYGRNEQRALRDRNAEALRGGRMGEAPASAAPGYPAFAVAGRESAPDGRREKETKRQASKETAFPPAGSEESYESALLTGLDAEQPDITLDAFPETAFGRPASAETEEAAEPFAGGEAVFAREETEEVQTFRRQILLSILILLSAPIAVALLRGIEAVLRLLPVFFVIDISVLLYLCLSFWEMRRKRNKKRTEAEAGENALQKSRESGLHLFTERPQEMPASLQLSAEKEKEASKRTPKTEEGGEEDLFATRQLFPLLDRNETKRLLPLSPAMPQIALSHFPFVIGKSRELTDFALPEERVSRMHLKIDRTENGYTVTDLNSTNGTKIDGSLLNANETAPLCTGQELSIAGIGYLFTDW